MYVQAMGTEPHLYTCKFIATPLYILTFIHVFRNKLCTKVGYFLYVFLYYTECQKESEARGVIAYHGYKKSCTFFRSSPHHKSNIC
jgi:hypothetical protein